MRHNLHEQLEWLGKCHSWKDVFGARMDMEALQQRVGQALQPELLMSRDWEPLWKRAADGCVNGGEVRDFTGRGKYSGKVTVSQQTPRQQRGHHGHKQETKKVGMKEK